MGRTILTESVKLQRIYLSSTVYPPCLDTLDVSNL